MIQTFRISDALRCVLLNAPRGPNLACSRESLSAGAASRLPVRLPRNTKLWKATLAQRQSRITVAWWDGIHFGGLASAGCHAGSRVWEVDHLYLPADTTWGGKAAPTGPARVRFRPPPGPEQVLIFPHHGEKSPLSDYERCTSPDVPCVELLEHLVQIAGQRCAERIFLRVPSDNPVIGLARRVGFFPYFEETLLEGQGGKGQSKKYPQIAQIDNLQESAKSVDEGALPTFLEPRTPQDDYGLFQLFSAATPSSVRVALGLTFDQWQDARERHGPARREWVTKHNGKIIGWLSLLPRRQVAEGEVMVHPDYPDLLPALMEFALAGGSAQRWLVPDYQEWVGELLQHRGFQEVARYTMLVKTVAARITSHGMVPVEA